MRRKSTRNAQKAAPEKAVKETEPSPKTRRSKRRKRSPSKSSESEEEAVPLPKRPEPEATPDTTTKSHTPTDDETSEEPVWKVTSSEDVAKGEIQKLKICLTRPSPDSPDKSKSRRSKSDSQTEDDATSSEDKSSTRRRTRSRGSPFIRNDGLSSQEGDEDVEEKKGKGKSKGKHKSKIDKSPHISEPEIQTNNEISENVQVTPQSPSIDKPVDNENDYNKVDDIQNVNESTEKEENVGEESASSVAHISDNDQNSLETNKNESLSQDNETRKSDVQDRESDDEPLSVIQKLTTEKQESVAEEVVNEDTQVTISAEEQQKEDDEVKIAQNEETSQENVQQIPEPIEAEKSDQDINQQALQSDDNNDKKTEHSSPVPTEQVEETEENLATEKNASQDDKAEIESQQTISEELPRQDVEEVRLTDDNDAEQSKTSIEDVKEPQISSPNESPKDDSEPASNTTEQAQCSSERSSRRRLNRNNELIAAVSDSREKEEGDEDACQIKPSKTKRKWDGNALLTSSLIKIDLECIQNVWPTIDFPEEPDLRLEIERERRRSVTESSAKKLDRKVSVEYKSDSSEKPSYEKQLSVSSTTQDGEDNSNIIAFNRKISIVDDTASKLKPPPSPAKNPVSNVLYITNLVRPFTLKQLKELLERTGKIKEEGFWTDRIKSKCYVQYETTEEAEATRNALHGVQWPIGNGKKLIIDYATVENLKNAKNPPPPPPAAPPADVKTSVKENLEPVEDILRNEEKGSKDAEKKRNEEPVREWDIGKKDVRRERSRSRDRSRKHKRSPTPSDDFISRKQRKAEESVPQKLMDDLFLKTKATPSIYWQPLSPEEITMKQQQRLIRMEEHKRRMEENSRMKGRDVGRGAFRRRYD